MIAKYIVLSNIVHLHTVSTYNNLIVRYKVYSSEHMECLSTQAEGISLKTMSKESYKKINLSYQSVSPYYWEKITLK